MIILKKFEIKINKKILEKWLNKLADEKPFILSYKSILDDFFYDDESFWVVERMKNTENKYILYRTINKSLESDYDTSFYAQIHFLSDDSAQIRIKFKIFHFIVLFFALIIFITMLISGGFSVLFFIFPIITLGIYFVNKEIKNFKELIIEKLQEESVENNMDSL